MIEPPRMWPSEDFQVWYVGAPDDVAAVILSDSRRRWPVMVRSMVEFGQVFVESVKPAIDELALQWRLIEPKFERLRVLLNSDVLP